jgi:predicted nuclease of predicted toxin-antitoxin system
MKALCDVHLSYKLVTYLNRQGVESIHINQILDKWNTKDQDICRFVDANDFVLITKDVDFRDSYFLQNKPAKLIRICLGNIPNQELIKLFEAYLDVFKEYHKKDKFYIEIVAYNSITIYE